MALMLKQGSKFIEISYVNEASDYIMATPKVIRAIRFKYYDPVRDYITIREYIPGGASPRIYVLDSKRDSIYFFASLRTRLAILVADCNFVDPEKVFITIEINPGY